MTDKLTHWLYPVAADSGYILETRHGPEQVTRAAFADVDYDAVAMWSLTNGYRTMRVGDLIWVYFASPDQAVGALARAVSIDHDENDGAHEVALSWDRPATITLLREPIPRAVLGATPQSVQRATGSAASVLEAWLADHGMSRGDLDGDDLDEEDARHRIRAEIVRREGQPLFRARLLQAYGSQCAITGCNVPEVLQTAHIAPYMGAASHTMANGLLLRADVHTLFDRYLIGVDGSG